MRETITTDEAVEAEGIDRIALYRVAREGLAPPGVCFYLGRRLYWRRSALKAWLENGGSRLAGGWRREPAGAA